MKSFSPDVVKALLLTMLVTVCHSCSESVSDDKGVGGLEKGADGQDEASIDVVSLARIAHQRREESRHDVIKAARDSVTEVPNGEVCVKIGSQIIFCRPVEYVVMQSYGSYVNVGLRVRVSNYEDANHLINSFPSPLVGRRNNHCIEVSQVHPPSRESTTNFSSDGVEVSVWLVSREYEQGLLAIDFSIQHARLDVGPSSPVP